MKIEGDWLVERAIISLHNTCSLVVHPSTLSLSESFFLF